MRQSGLGGFCANQARHKRQIDVEFEKDLGAQLEVTDHDMGFLFIEAGLEFRGDDHDGGERDRRALGPTSRFA